MNVGRSVRKRTSAVCVAKRKHKVWRSKIDVYVNLVKGIERKICMILVIAVLEDYITF